MNVSPPKYYVKIRNLFSPHNAMWLQSLLLGRVVYVGNILIKKGRSQELCSQFENCCILLCLGRNSFSHILQACITGIWVIIVSPRNNPDVSMSVKQAWGVCRCYLRCRSPISFKIYLAFFTNCAAVLSSIALKWMALRDLCEKREMIW